MTINSKEEQRMAKIKVAGGYDKIRILKVKLWRPKTMDRIEWASVVKKIKALRGKFHQRVKWFRTNSWIHKNEELCSFHRPPNILRVLLFYPSWSCTITCCINWFISLCKNLLPSSIENDAHGIEKLLLKTQVSKTSSCIVKWNS